MTATDDWRRRWEGAVMDTYGTPPVVLASGRGAHVVDVDGREYVDLVGGIAVNVLGHAHPAVVEAVARQVATLGHTSNLAVTRPAVELAERLLALDGRPGRVFFCNSGAEANEAALKLARLTGRPHVVAAEGSFHGRTTGALSITGQPAKRGPFEPLLPGARFVPYGEVGALERALSQRDVAATFLEPIQGEAGVVVPPVGYLSAARRLTAAAGTLLVLDEVQTGVARTGRWFAYQSEDARPDVVTVAKGLGGGLPLGACVAFGGAAELLRPGQHGSTFGGNPVACAAALAVLDTVERDGLLQRAEEVGARLRVALASQPGVADVRGAGLLCGVRLVDPVARDLERELRARGFLVNGTGADLVRLAPPLVVDEADLDAFVAAWPSAVAAIPVPTALPASAR